MKKSEIDVIRDLANGMGVGGSRFSESLLQIMLQEHLLLSESHGRRVSYKAASPSEVSSFFASELAAADSRDALSRAELVQATGDSKSFRVRSCPGFPVNCYGPLNARLKGKDIVLNPLEGTFTFICDWTEFAIEPDVVVVGVENMENFRMVSHQSYLFENLCAPVLFVSRYPQSGDLVSWLRTIPNRYLHFGDLDLAGIHIFLNEFYKSLGTRAEFFIPFDADARVSCGSRERYDDQIARFGSMEVSDPRVQYLVDLIHKHHKGYDQEGFIQKPD